VLELRDLALNSPDGRPLVEGLNLRVPKGGNQQLTGPSGCGKSQLLKVLAGTERPARGQVRVCGCAVWPGEGAFALAGRVRVGLAFATGGLLSNLSLRDNLALPLRFRGLSPAAVQARVEGALEALELGPVAGLRPHALSASARRHGNLARVLALDPDLILLDDPLEGLDSADRARALALIDAWAADPDKTLLVALEEPEPLGGGAWAHLDLFSLPIPMEAP